MSAAALVAAGDSDAALAALDRYRPGSDDEAPARDLVLAQVELLRAHALAALGRWSDAYAAAVKAHDATAALPKRAEQFSADGKARLSAAWLRAALAWRSGERTATIPGVALPERLHGKLGYEQAFDAIGMVLALVRTEPDARRAGRRQVVGTWLNAPEALGAAMYLVGEAARDQGDAEVYLDRMFSRQISEGTRRCAYARGLAAEWRGDQAAAKQWQARVAQLTALAKDGATAMLAHQAGL
jgi:hypothetical protein